MSRGRVLRSSDAQFAVFALLTLINIAKEYEAFVDSISGSELGISNRKLQKFTKITRELQLALRSFISESCLEVNLVLEFRHCYVLYILKSCNEFLKSSSKHLINEVNKTQKA